LQQAAHKNSVFVGNAGSAAADPFHGVEGLALVSELKV
jgi:hypothetical protein